MNGVMRLVAAIVLTLGVPVWGQAAGGGGGASARDAKPTEVGPGDVGPDPVPRTEAAAGLQVVAGTVDDLRRHACSVDGQDAAEDRKPLSPFAGSGRHGWPL